MRSALAPSSPFADSYLSVMQRFIERKEGKVLLYLPDTTTKQRNTTVPPIEIDERAFNLLQPKHVSISARISQPLSADELLKNLSVLGFTFSKFIRENSGKIDAAAKANAKDLVTDIDKGIEYLFTLWIRHAYPRHKIIGEEGDKDEIAPGDYVWYIDPVDGTDNFVHNEQNVGLNICCVHDGSPVVSFVGMPLRGTAGVYYAGSQNTGVIQFDTLAGLDHPAKMPPPVQPAKITTIGTEHTRGDGEAFDQARLAALKKAYSLDDAVIKSISVNMVLLLEGKTGLFYKEDVKLWDIMAAISLLDFLGGYEYRLIVGPDHKSLNPFSTEPELLNRINEANIKSGKVGFFFAYRKTPADELSENIIRSALAYKQERPDTPVLTGKDTRMVPLKCLKEGYLETEYVSEKDFKHLQAGKLITPVIEHAADDPDTGEIVPQEAYFHNDAIAFLLEDNIIEKAYTAPKTFTYVSRIVESQLVESEWGKYALITGEGAASFDGERVLVYGNGLQHSGLRKGIRLYAVKELIERFDTPQAQALVRSAYETANKSYGDAMTIAGKYLIDEAVQLAETLTEPYYVPPSPELTAAALLFSVDRNRLGKVEINNIPKNVWGWIDTFRELNSLEFIPPRTARKQRTEDAYIQNYIYYLVKHAGSAVQPLLLLMAYRLEHFLAEREKLGAAFDERYKVQISAYSVLAEQLGLKNFSDMMKSFSFRKAHEKKYRAILRHVNKTFGVYYRDLSVFAWIFREQIVKEIRDLERAKGRKIALEIQFNVKDPGSIDEKILNYAEKYKRSYNNPLDGIAELTDLVRGKIIVAAKKDLELIKTLPLLIKISGGDFRRSTAVAKKVIGPIPAIKDHVDTKVLRQAFSAHKPPKTVTDALERLAKAPAAGKTALQVEVQIQTPDMSRKEFTGKALHSVYKLNKLGYDLLGSDQVYYKTSDLAGLTKRMRDINSEHQVAGSEFIRCRYQIKGEAVEYYHNVPLRLSDAEDTRPAVIDVLTRRDMAVLRNYILKPAKILINGRAVRHFGERVSTADVVEIQTGAPDPALQEQIDAVISYVQGNGDRKAAGAALPAGNPQSRVAVEMLLDNMSDEACKEICKAQLDLLTRRIVAGSSGRFVPDKDDDLRSWLESYNLLHWAFRRSNLLQECCLAMHYGFVDMTTVANAVLRGRGWELLSKHDTGITPGALETLFLAAQGLAGDESVREALKPFGTFPPAMTAKEMAERVALDVGKGMLDAETAVNKIQILEVLTEPLNPPEPRDLPAAAFPIETAA